MNSKKVINNEFTLWPKRLFLELNLIRSMLLFITLSKGLHMLLHTYMQCTTKISTMSDFLCYGWHITNFVAYTTMYVIAYVIVCSKL